MNKTIVSEIMFVDERHFYLLISSYEYSNSPVAMFCSEFKALHFYLVIFAFGLSFYPLSLSVIFTLSLLFLSFFILCGAVFFIFGFQLLDFLHTRNFKSHFSPRSVYYFSVIFFLSSFSSPHSTQ